MPGSFTSSTYMPRPRRNRASSLRILRPKPTVASWRGSVVVMRAPPHWSPLLRTADGQRPTGLPARCSRSRCIGTAARRLPRGSRPRRIRILVEQRSRRDHHAGGAEPALQPVLGHEALLDRVEFAVLFQALDGAYRATVGHGGEHRAALDRHAVHGYHADPQLDVSQPQCVPVSPSSSRRKCTSSSRGSMSRVTSSSLTVICTCMLRPPVRGSARWRCAVPAGSTRRPAPACSRPDPAGQSGGWHSAAACSAARSIVSSSARRPRMASSVAAATECGAPDRSQADPDLGDRVAVEPHGCPG